MANLSIEDVVDGPECAYLRHRCLDQRDQVISEVDNLMLESSMERRAEAGTHVDPATEERGEVSLERH